MASRFFSYSTDGGNSWLGPFSQEEFTQLQANGMVPSDCLIRNNEQTAHVQMPPMVPNAAQYYIMVDGRQQGPYAAEMLQELLRAGKLEMNAQVWAPGMSGWGPLSSVVMPNEQSPGTNSQPGQFNVFPSPLPQVEGISLAHFFAEIFKHHTHEEVVDFFCRGSSKTTPDLRDVSCTWPSPWVFSRVLVFFGIMIALLYYCLSKGVLSVIAAYIMLGSMSVPVCTMILAYELNIRRDVSFYTVIKVFMLGGVLSLLFTSFIEANVQYREAYWAGPVEEIAKLFAVVLMASTYRKGSILTGVLLGCAIGAGFAVMETMWYVLGNILSYIDISSVYNTLVKVGAPESVIKDYVNAARAHYADPDWTLLMRSILAPAGHVVWTAITAGAFWMVMGEKVKAKMRSANDTSIDFSIFKNLRFLSIACIPVILHMVWNSSFGAEHLEVKRLAIGVIGWFVLLRLVQMGINQVKEEKTRLGF